MAKFFFIVPPLTGHINPTLGLGKELIERNHEVFWISFDPELEKQLPEKGKLLLIPFSLSEEEKSNLLTYIEHLKKKVVYGIDSLKFLYEDVLIPMNNYIIDGISELLTDNSPDIVITDHQIFAGAISCLKQKIPYVTSVTAPASIKINKNLPMVHQWESKQVIAFQKTHGIMGDQRIDCSNLLTLVYTSKEFFGDSQLPSYYKFIGPIINSRKENISFNWDKLNLDNKSPKILVSIGTTFDHKQKFVFFNKVIDAFRNEKITVVLVSDPKLFTHIPDNFIIQQKVPQLEIIPHMQAVVCHGGNNTVCESLSFGIPLVVIPIAYDQSYVSGCVTENFAGIRLKFNRFKSQHLKEAIHLIINDKKYKNGAKRIQKSFINAGGLQKGADYLEKLIYKK